jgi:excisionase family DNA binding protein
MSTDFSIKKIFTRTLLTASEAAQILGITTKQLIRYCKSEKISYFKIGKQYRFMIEEILDFKNNK